MRIDDVYAKLRQLAGENGVSAKEIADAMNIGRSNVSHELNKLVQQGKARKKSGKPVLFQPVIQQVVLNESRKDILGAHLKLNPSLKIAIEQARAAVLYPPDGMNMLILGETGVGKSLFAELIVSYAQHNNIIPAEAELIIFNCADYSNNPQLLIAQLFGTRKGAYTGIDENRIGLIEKANNSFLFLDEVHRLPHEGQEMLFTFMDKGVYRRLGEADALRTANVKIIAATTETPESHLLRTFTRRFPITIRLPALRERTLQERIKLVHSFLQTESKSIQCSISISGNALRAFYIYDCPNNIGQLRADLRSACAKAYVDYVTGIREIITITSDYLPQHVSAFLLNETEHRKLWNELLGGKTKFTVFHPSGDIENENMFFLNEQQKGTTLQKMELSTLFGAGPESSYLQSLYATKLSLIKSKDDIKTIQDYVTGTISELTDEIIQLSQKRLEKTFDINFQYALSIHLEKTLNRLKFDQLITHPRLNDIRIKHNREFNVALDCLRIIEKKVDISMPIDEAAFLTMLFIHYEDSEVLRAKQVRVMLIMHGESAATSMADTVNELLDVEYVKGFNLSLKVQPQIILEQIIAYIKTWEVKSDLFLLVDMGSLSNFGAVILRECGVRTKTMQLVSTMHVIEAVQKAMLGLPLEEIYNEVLGVNYLLDQSYRAKSEFNRQTKKLAIVMVSSSEEDLPETLTSLSNRLTYKPNILEIIPIISSDKQDIAQRLKSTSYVFDIVSVITNIPIPSQWRTLRLDEILWEENITTLQAIIDIETTYVLLVEPLNGLLKNTSASRVVTEVRKAVLKISEAQRLNLTANAHIGIAMHLSCLIDKKLTDGPASAPIRQTRAGNQAFSRDPVLKIFSKELHALETKFQIEFSDDEIVYLKSLFEQNTF
ncbi:sigma-54-dependent transcriptional regulator [Klebsiella oxytoca]|uniref:sigma-54-dependent transcriptional regulator n=1 Tax=Klebsiella oxytoca TaxID=571 RepID=UPI00195CF029|nr:sigma 54-interacting transcriptional regulator [Klebsiella oxytoca]QRS16984.1 sigma 54-interacting transcriptional regulator [Klebsiella oxytoca]